MALFRCTPFPGGFTPPPSSGSAIEGPRDWSVASEDTLTGSILRVDVTAPAQEIPGYKITHYEVALAEQNGATTVRRLLGGPAVEYVRRFRIDTPGTDQRVHLRTVWQHENQISWSSGSTPFYRPVPGDAVVQPASGATATVRAVADGPGGGTFFVVLGDIAGPFEDENDVTIAGNPGFQGSAMHCTYIDAERETIKSEWSLPRDVTPATGTPTVPITASKTTCLPDGHGCGAL